jgi:hypothetical protein
MVHKSTSPLRPLVPASAARPAPRTHRETSSRSLHTATPHTHPCAPPHSTSARSPTICVSSEEHLLQDLARHHATCTTRDVTVRADDGTHAYTLTASARWRSLAFASQNRVIIW